VVIRHADRRAIDFLRRIRRQDLREVHAPLAFEGHADQAADPARAIVHADASRILGFHPLDCQRWMKRCGLPII
jgi:hypothetical protein